MLLKNILSLMKFMGLEKEQRRIVFYSEGEVYWVHLEGVLKKVLELSDIPVCYISSSIDDPGLKLKHKNLKTYTTDEGWLRNWLFENIETDLLVMTMPDLHQYQVKRSQHPVNYVYMQHSLVSFHMVYRPGAFDYFDTVFCAAPHHIREIRALEEKYGLPKKRLFDHGYSRLDSILEHASLRPEKKPNETIHVLLAPSWGINSITDLIAFELIAYLLEENFTVTFRPHPMSLKFSKAIIKKIVSKYSSRIGFIFENNIAGQESLHQSDVMICDWSGAALDYAFGLHKPVLFIDVPRKINNKNYTDIEIEPFEVNIRSKIGNILAVGSIDKVGRYVTELVVKNNKGEIDFSGVGEIFNTTKSDEAGAKYLIGMIDEIERKARV